MSIIPFTQYTCPYGRIVKVNIDRPASIAEMAYKIIGAGYRFECELLNNQEVSLTVSNEDEGDMDGELVPDGPEVPLAVDRLITRFYSRIGEPSANG